MVRRVIIIIFLCVAILPVQAVAQNVYRDFFQEEYDDSFTMPSASDQVTIGVTVLDNLSLKMVAGKPIMLTNFKWGATLQIDTRDQGIIRYFASVNF